MTSYFEFAKGVNLTEHIFEQLPKGDLIAKPAGHIVRGEHVWLIGEGEAGVTRQFVPAPSQDRGFYYLGMGYTSPSADFDVTDAEWSEDGYEFSLWPGYMGGVEYGRLRIPVTVGSSTVTVRAARPSAHRWEPVERRFLWWQWMGSRLVPVRDAKGVKFTPAVQAKIDAKLAELEAVAKVKADAKQLVKDAYDAALATPVLILDENRTSSVDVQQTNTKVEVRPLSRYGYGGYGWY